MPYISLNTWLITSIHFIILISCRLIIIVLWLSNRYFVQCLTQNMYETTLFVLTFLILLIFKWNKNVNWVSYNGFDFPSQLLHFLYYFTQQIFNSLLITGTAWIGRVMPTCKSLSWYNGQSVGQLGKGLWILLKTLSNWT